ncbi:hypothetical protein GBA52_027889 [Prunus armeniaca]|nr:hypothetical protein GBA52_027889 [Prunus armeniaca]
MQLQVTQTQESFIESSSSSSSSCSNSSNRNNNHSINNNIINNHSMHSSSSEAKAAAASFQGVFCRDIAVVGNLLSQVGFNRPITVKYEALSC